MLFFRWIARERYKKKRNKVTKKKLTKTNIFCFDRHTIVDGSQLRLVALNEPMPGDMGGIQRVDYACFRQARQAGLKVRMAPQLNRVFLLFFFKDERLDRDLIG